MSDGPPDKRYSPVEVSSATGRSKLTATEFHDWIPFKEAVALIDAPWTHELAMRIAKRLWDGSFVAGTGESRCVTTDGIIVQRTHTIEPSVWMEVEGLNNGGHSVWEHSEFSVKLRDDSGIGWLVVNYYDVRFEWSRLFRVFPELKRRFARSGTSPFEASLLKGDIRPANPAAGVPSAPLVRPKPEKVRRPTDSAVQAWLEKYEAKFPGLPHNRRTAAFNTTHPNFSGGKRQLYRVRKKVRGRLTIGNPQISRRKLGN